MSVTTTQNPVSQTVLHLLTDYELHHSGETTADGGLEAPNARNAETSQNPEWWPTNYRRIPDHRPINRHLDKSLRPNGTNPIEMWFIFTMLGGVTLKSVSFHVFQLPACLNALTRIGAISIFRVRGDIQVAESMIVFLDTKSAGKDKQVEQSEVYNPS